MFRNRTIARCWALSGVAVDAQEIERNMEAKRKKEERNERKIREKKERNRKIDHQQDKLASLIFQKRKLQDADLKDNQETTDLEFLKSATYIFHLI